MKRTIIAVMEIDDHDNTTWKTDITDMLIDTFQGTEIDIIEDNIGCYLVRPNRTYREVDSYFDESIDMDWLIDHWWDFQETMFDDIPGLSGSM